MREPSKPKGSAGGKAPRPVAATGGHAYQEARPTRIAGLRLHHLVGALCNEVREASRILERDEPEPSDFVISSVAFDLSFVVIAAGPDGVQVHLAAEALKEVTPDKIQKMRFTLVDLDSPVASEQPGAMATPRDQAE